VQNAVEEEFLKQRKIRQWDKTKTKVLNDALFYNGIKPGAGKWMKLH